MTKFTNNEKQSLSIAVWLVTDEYNHNRYPGKLSISATSLLKPARMTILSNRILTSQTITPEDDGVRGSLVIFNDSWNGISNSFSRSTHSCPVNRNFLSWNS